MNTVEDGLTKRLFTMAMYLALTIFALAGWASITSGPGYMQVRVIVTVIAAMTFYLLFSGDLRRIVKKMFSKDTDQIKQVAPTTHQSALSPQSGPVPALGVHLVNTSEIVAPPSVTERTTSLLKNNKS
ncbi:MAG: hypothetical protein M3R52_09245 [Acidobacteriota bacterium]|nr:hypothetical protein [Acidobacteriota bacterium]MDQ2937505.1 hypothetical protein [Acidobacteriota bacterium]